MKKCILEAVEIDKGYETIGKEVKVLNHVSVSIVKGDFTVIMGPSGAGKSTLLYALSGMDNINSGKILYHGLDITQMKEKKLAEIRANEFGFVFQQTNLVSNLTLYENVVAAGYISSKYKASEVEERTKKLFNQMNVLRAMERLPAQTSGGEAQRAAIARAMINDPGIVFADEPTGSLNKSNTEEVLDLFSAINNSGQSILMVTHDIRTAIRGNRILYLDDGIIVDELVLPKYKEAPLKEREEILNSWLTSLQW